MSPVDSLKNSIAEKEEELSILKEALIILTNGEKKGFKFMPAEPSVAPPSAPLQSEIPERTAEPAPIRSIPKPTGPRCGACGAGMYPTYRTMPSGAVVNLLKCNDNACGNEAYSS
jgi:hypothetical protein